MTPRQLDPDVVVVRLALMRQALRDLDAVGHVDEVRLREDRLARRAVERLLAHLVDVAAEVNAHVVGARLGRAPRDLRESFDLAAEAGVVTVELAHALGGSAGMRNVIVHTYLDLDLRRVAEAVPLAAEQFGRYVQQAAASVLDSDPPTLHG